MRTSTEHGTDPPALAVPYSPYPIFEKCLFSIAGLLNGEEEEKEMQQCFESDQCA